ELTLNDNALEILPPELGRLQNLKKLHLYGNNLHSLPDTLSQLKNLQVIELTRNKFTHIPRWIFFMPYLKTLYLERNPIKEIDFGDFRGINEEPYPSFNGGIYVDGSVKVYIDLPSWDPPPRPPTLPPPTRPSSHFPMVVKLYDRYSHDREYGPARVKLRPIERYFGDLLAGNLSESYYPRVISDTTGEMKKNLLEQLPHDHVLIDPLRKALERELKNSLSLQL
ncbi:MAG: leucine-rich repeat domain-containing protein, partial [Promethearchaeota archaeon]